MLFNLFLFGCASGDKISSTAKDGFPDTWWQSIPDDQVAEWEIAPQKANREKSEVVLSKRTELGKFSNLHPLEFNFENEHYASVEGLWQSMKYPEGEKDERLKDTEVIWPYTRKQVMLMSGFEAKKAGDLASANMKKLNIKWVTYKGKKLNYSDVDQDTHEHYNIILNACRAKLAADKGLRALLLSTKSLTFLSDHKQKPDSPPAYRYHEIYMKLRNELEAAIY